MPVELVFSWTVVFIASEWVIRVVMLAVVVERHPPRSAMTWLLVIFFLPWPGLLLYLLIGENRLPQGRLLRRRALMQRLESVRDRYVHHRDGLAVELDDEFAATVTLAEKLGYMPIMHGNTADLLADTDDVINRLIADIDAAEHHVHLLFYIFEANETGERVEQALVRAVQRGVRCRLLVDAQGSRRFLKKRAKRLRAQGIELYAALPGGLLRVWVARIDLRNHRKIAVIDGWIGYTGSQNIVSAGYGHKDLRWYDLMARMRGPVVLELQAVFVGDWLAESDELLDGPEIFPELSALPGGIAIQALPSGPLFPVENYQRLVVAALYSARRQVTITTPYFVPDEGFLEAIETAALRGVNVELIVPLQSDQILVGNAAKAYYQQLMERGVRVLLFDQGLLHAKSMTVDGSLGFLGSSNFDIRSFALNFEINMIFYDGDAVQALYEHQDWFRCRSTELSLSEWRKRPVRQKVFQNVVKLMSPLL